MANEEKATREMSHAEAAMVLMEIMRYCARDKRDVEAIDTAIRQLVRRDRQMSSNRLNRLARGVYRTPTEAIDAVTANPPLPSGGCKQPIGGEGGAGEGGAK